MVEKVAAGYRCEHCGSIIPNKQKALGHEGVCAENKLDNFMEGNVGKLVGLNTGGFEKKELKQLRIGERYVGRCGSCKHPVTTRHAYSEDRELYECPKCENVLKTKGF